MNFKSLQERLEKHHLYHTQAGSKPLLDASVKVFNQNRYIHQCKELTSANNTLRADLIELIKENNQLKNKVRRQRQESNCGQQLQRLKQTIEQLSQELHQLRPRRPMPEINIVQNQEQQDIHLQLQSECDELRLRLDLAEKQITPLEELSQLLKTQNQECSRELKDATLRLAQLLHQNQRMREQCLNSQQLNGQISLLKAQIKEKQQDFCVQRSQMHSSFSLEIAKLSLQNDQKNSSIQKLQAEANLLTDQLTRLKSQLSLKQRHLTSNQIELLRSQLAQDRKLLDSKTNQLAQSQSANSGLRQRLSSKDKQLSLKDIEIQEAALKLQKLQQSTADLLRNSQSEKSALQQLIQKLSKELAAETQLSQYTSLELESAKESRRASQEKARILDQLVGKLGCQAPDVLLIIQNMVESLKSSSRNLSEMRQINLQLKQQLQLMLNRESSLQQVINQPSSTLHSFQQQTLEQQRLQKQVQVQVGVVLQREQKSQQTEPVNQWQTQLQKQLKEVRKSSKTQINQLRFKIQDLQISSKRVKALEKQNEQLRKELDALRAQTPQ